MGGRRLIIQHELAFPRRSEGEALARPAGRTEPRMATGDLESPTTDEQLIEEICERENLKKALKRVRANKGSPGIDGMTVGELPRYLTKHWPTHREELLGGTYRPKPVKRVEIPKSSGGVRKLGIPCVLDRFVQQAVQQVLQHRWDPTFSEHSYGFRPRRSAHQAVVSAQTHVENGYEWVVDIDLEKFFDQVHHDRLMSRLASRISDKRVLRLTRAFLQAGVMEDGRVSPTTRGTPQGGPLSPLLSNIVLDELDRELERRGHRFCRYADDCRIYVRSERAGHRVMSSVSRFISRKLKLKVNESKSAVAHAWERQFLGFILIRGKRLFRGIGPKAIASFRRRIRRVTHRGRGVSLQQMAEELAPYLRGWRAYFGNCEIPSMLEGLDSWIRRRLRCVAWKRWKTRNRRIKQLRRRGVEGKLLRHTAGSSRGPWHISRSPALNIALPNVYFDSLGLPRLAVR